MALASLPKVVLGCVSFIVFWILALFPSVRCLPIGRTAGSLLGAILMVIFQVVSPEEAYKAIDLQILGLLFGTMVVGIYLERADMFKYLEHMLSWRTIGGKDLLFRVCILSALASALLTNDTCCVVLTQFVMKLCREKNLPRHPFLLALASSANIGSSATPIGNPQNLVIAVQSKISFGKFLLGILPSMLIGVLINILILWGMYWKELSVQSDGEYITVEMSGDNDVRLEQDGAQTHCSSAINISNLQEGEEVEHAFNRWRRTVWRACVYLVTIGMLVALLCGLDMSWTAITAAITLVILDFTDAGPSLDKVSYSLLLFFGGMFITIDGFNKTGIPGTLWKVIEPHARIDSLHGVVTLSLVITLLSNLASNVPTVLLLGPQVAKSAAAMHGESVAKAWLILAWVSTVAGNLSLIGSAANLIVCEQARTDGYELSFWTHLRFGFPATLIVMAIGLPLINLL